MPNPIPKTDESLKAHAQQALNALKTARVTIVTAESCTAGSIAALLAEAEGATQWHLSSASPTCRRRVAGCRRFNLVAIEFQDEQANGRR